MRFCQRQLYGPTPVKIIGTSKTRWRSLLDAEQAVPQETLFRDDSYASYFMATWRMHFPFLACEVKCGNTALDAAVDRMLIV